MNEVPPTRYTYPSHTRTIYLSLSQLTLLYTHIHIPAPRLTARHASLMHVRRYVHTRALRTNQRMNERTNTACIYECLRESGRARRREGARSSRDNPPIGHWYRYAMRARSPPPLCLYIHMYIHVRESNANSRCLCRARSRGPLASIIKRAHGPAYLQQ